ncbi:hypothetical protein C0638_06725 [Paenibacillus sp. lzh-N1]|uniref:restriction endonuclease subunit S n=1 Tax=Paenibacillus sp. lzh-N1 TaxID=2069255 RepID=UPI000C809196|nr:restriction endonuclease subunit S [Paenibacillus sp. lzh-N1]AUO06250.1 hypothetical protein C0638_06725 [Paenibacillus sp. lzh-N1]
MTYPLVRLKFIAKEKLMYGANESAELDDRDLPRYIRITDLDAAGKLKEETFKSLEWEKAKPYLLEKGDILFARSGATVGKAYIHESDEPACYAGYLIKLKVDLKKCLPKFIFYYTQTNKYSSWITENTIQATIQNVSAEKYANLLVPLPALNIQKTIISYLEKRVASLDELISKKTLYITILEQQRQSIITEAVTKGLNSNVKMKDSGVEWISEIPEHWLFSRLDFISRVKARLGWKGLKAEEYVEDGYVFLATPNLKEREIDFTNVNFITEERYLESPEIMLEVGDVLLAKDGSTLGIVNVIRSLPKKATVNSSIAVLRPNEKIDSVYFYYYLKSTYIQDVINQIKDGMGVPHLFQADIKKFKVLLPPIEEQIVIAKYIDDETLKLEKLMDKVKKQSEALKEYRQSLIYEAVTGKIDVRDMELDEVR